MLLLLYVDDCSSIRGRTRLQKMVFVFEEEILKQNGFDKLLSQNHQQSLFDFKPHYYGPFSEKVLTNMEFFVNVGMVEAKCDIQDGDFEEALAGIDDQQILMDDLRELPDGLEDDEAYGIEDEFCIEPEYFLSETGKKYVNEKLIVFISGEQKNALTILKKNFNKISLNNILRYVYTKYPNMSEESLIKDTVLEKPWQF